MILLLDTHVVLWWLIKDDLLLKKHETALMDGNNICYVSSAVFWEISIKKGLGKIRIPEDYADTLKGQGFLELPISWEHALKVEKLPLLHKDPFDRILIAQALVEDMVLLSVDAQFKEYGVRVF